MLLGPRKEPALERTDIVIGYLDALGIAQEPPSLALLSEITSRHVAAFPFASIGPRLRDELPLEPERLFDRIVVRHRGGYCFEQNGLLHEVLEGLGFDVDYQLARVVNNQDIHPGLTHRVVLVRLAGTTYVADVGFGPKGPPMPVPLAAPAPGNFSVVEGTPGAFCMQLLVDGEPYTLYRFDRVRYGQADCELGHFYSHRHPQAMFVNNLVASRILAGEVRSLRNREYWVIRPEGEDHLRIDSAAGLHRLLEEELLLNVTRDEAARLFDALPA